MPTPTAELTLDYLPLADGARLVRVYGVQPCITLPETVPAPNGGQLPLTELGDYCFAETPRTTVQNALLCRCVTDANGIPHLVESVCTDDTLHPIAGRFLEELTLPDALRVLGSCAFYNCRTLRRLSVGGGRITAGSDVFLNDFALHEFIVRAAPEQATGLFALVNCVQSAVRAVFVPTEDATPAAALWYPEYWEDYEETPAHILLHTFSGQGYHYRQCFLNNIVLWNEYDAVFPQGHDSDDASVMAMLCFDRLRYPYQLRADVVPAYRAFLSAHTDLVITRLLKQQDMDALHALLSLDVMDEAAFAVGAALAAKGDHAEAAALLADAEHRMRAAKQTAAPRRARYDFDF